MTPLSTDQLPGYDLRERVSTLGERLSRELGAVSEAVPGHPVGPQRLAKALGLDKVFASRLLKALRTREHLAVVHQLPGPEPLRRFLVAAKRVGVASDLILPARAAVEAFEALIRDEAGDRRALGAILGAWLPEVRAQLDLSARQAAYRAVGQILGSQAEFGHSTVILHPAADDKIDVVWIMGMVGVQRLRPGASVRFDTRRLAFKDGERRPTDLNGAELSGLGFGPESFSSGPNAPIVVHQAGEVMHYMLGDTGFGNRSAANVLFCELNRAELAASVPKGSKRRAWFYADVNTAVKRTCFNIFVHNEVYPNTAPELVLYNKTSGGVADVNDRARDIDILDSTDRIIQLGQGLDRTPLGNLPRYRDLLEHTYSTLGWNPAEFRGYRVQIDYPMHGAQVTFTFVPPESP